MKRPIRNVVRALLVLFIVAVLGITIGCVRQSGGVWYFHEAKRPVGWPDLTPVGQVQIKKYPGYREAVVRNDTKNGTQDDAQDKAQDRMFRELFKHIQSSDIAMTAPVDMTYQQNADKPQVRSMSFLYDVPERGPVAASDDLIVRDVPAATYVSMGVRGSYTDEHFDEALKQLQQWLAEQKAVEPVGSPRYLGYNSPFVPFFWRYGEVQIPVQSVAQ